ncbi:MAG TPA: sigma 54-interacting transcriptional regulator [Bryobacteraceae bacterium]
MSGRILIVEDERITAEDLHDILAGLGYTVCAAVSSGAEAIAAAGETHCDLALMDIQIKGTLDGAETARILRERFNIPVIFLTAHADYETVSRAKFSEPLGYIIKPFQEGELHASIEIALHKHAVDLKSLSKSELFASTLRAISEGVISVDRAESVTFLNPAAEGWTGWSLPEAVGRQLREVFPLMDAASGEGVETPLWRVLGEGSLDDLGEDVLLLHRSGDSRSVAGSIAPIRDHQGAVSGAVIAFGHTVAPPTGPVSPGLPPEITVGVGGFKMVAASPAMKQVLRFARRVAESEVSTILIEGESGAGKDIIAQFIHHFGSRRQGPFVAINCTAIPDNLLESELFGYEKGAFTDAHASKAGILEIASGGTIFLDEIGEMPIVLQAKLLRVLEEQKFRRLGGVRDIQVDARVLAATNCKLTEAIEQGKFRLDLYYRLNVIQVFLPALRDRKEDILPLAENFVRLYNVKFKRDILGISTGAGAMLLAYDWPGNVRELRNVIERAMVLEDSNWIQTASLHLASPGINPLLAESADEPEEASFTMSLEEIERNLLSKALTKAAGNQTRAAVILGITRDTLRYKMKKFSLR